jgi:hypothetical protein
MKTFIVVASILLGGCSSQAVVSGLDDARSVTDDIQQEATERYKDLITPESLDFMKQVDGPIMVGEETALKRALPPVFYEKWHYSSYKERGLIDVIKNITSSKGIIITTRDDVYNPTSTMINTTDENGNSDSAAIQVANEVRTENNLDRGSRILLPAGTRYDGDVEGFFDLISTILNISWEYLYIQDRVVFTRYDQKSYELIVPKSPNSSSVWASAEETITTFLSQGGRVTVNEYAGTITVKDTKDVQVMVEDFIGSLNDSLKLSVVLDVNLVSIRTTDENSSRIGLDVSNTGNSGGPRSLNLSSVGSSTPGAGGLVATILNGSPFSGSEFLLQNLDTKSEITSSRSRVIRAANNTVARIDQVTIIPSLTSFTPTTLTTDGIVIPGSASLENKTIGFSMELIPSIMKDGQNMMLSLKLNTSELLDVVEIPIGAEGQYLQSLVTDSREYEHVFTMVNEEMLVISGLQDTSTRFNETKLGNDSWYSWVFNMLGTSAKDSAEDVYYVVTITPRILTGATL